MSGYDRHFQQGLADSGMSFFDDQTWNIDELYDNDLADLLNSSNGEQADQYPGISVPHTINEQSSASGQPLPIPHEAYMGPSPSVIDPRLLNLEFSTSESFTPNVSTPSCGPSPFQGIAVAAGEMPTIQRPVSVASTPGQLQPPQTPIAERFNQERLNNHRSGHYAGFGQQGNIATPEFRQQLGIPTMPGHAIYGAKPYYGRPDSQIELSSFQSPYGTTIHTVPGRSTPQVNTPIGRQALRSDRFGQNPVIDLTQSDLSATNLDLQDLSQHAQEDLRHLRDQHGATNMAFVDPTADMHAYANQGMAHQKIGGWNSHQYQHSLARTHQQGVDLGNGDLADLYSNSLQLSPEPQASSMSPPPSTISRPRAPQTSKGKGRAMSETPSRREEKVRCIGTKTDGSACNKNFHPKADTTDDRCARCALHWIREHGLDYPVNFQSVPEVRNIPDARDLIYPPPDAPQGPEESVKIARRAREREDEHVQRFLDAINAVNPNEEFWLSEHQRNLNANALQKNEYSQIQVTARVRALFNELVVFHTGEGMWLYATGGTNANYPIKRNIGFEERMDLICAKLATNKRVAMDVIEGRGVQGLVASPEDFGKRKENNEKANKKKKRTLEMGRGVEEGEAADSDGDFDDESIAVTSTSRSARGRGGKAAGGSKRKQPVEDDVVESIETTEGQGPASKRTRRSPRRRDNEESYSPEVESPPLAGSSTSPYGSGRSNTVGWVHGRGR